MMKRPSLGALAAAGGALAILMATLLSPLRVLAGSAQPTTQWSFYMRSTSATAAYNLGCSQGSFDLQHSIANTLVFLDFGNQLPNGSGTEEVGNQWTFSNYQIEVLSDEYADGFYYCTGNDTTSQLKLAVGTRNSHDITGEGTTYSNGQVWSNVVGAVQSHANSSFCYNGRCESAQVYVWGGDDIEPGWGSAANAEAWANGFGSVGHAYLNYGSPDGCPTTSDADQPCANGWYQYDVWYVSWGATPALASPIVYQSWQASAWTMISLYGYNYHNGDAALYEGPLDENAGDNNSTQAWSELYWDLYDSGLPSSVANFMGYSLEVHSE